MKRAPAQPAHLPETLGGPHHAVNQTNVLFLVPEVSRSFTARFDKLRANGKLSETAWRKK
jgi:hypothetical protein